MKFRNQGPGVRWDEATWGAAGLFVVFLVLGGFFALGLNALFTAP